MRLFYEFQTVSVNILFVVIYSCIKRTQSGKATRVPLEIVQVVAQMFDDLHLKSTETGK